MTTRKERHRGMKVYHCCRKCSEEKQVVFNFKDMECTAKCDFCGKRRATCRKTTDDPKTANEVAETVQAASDFLDSQSNPILAELVSIRTQLTILRSNLHDILHTESNLQERIDHLCTRLQNQGQSKHQQQPERTPHKRVQIVVRKKPDLRRKENRAPHSYTDLVGTRFHKTPLL